MLYPSLEAGDLHVKGVTLDFLTFTVEDAVARRQIVSIDHHHVVFVVLHTLNREE